MADFDLMITPGPDIEAYFPPDAPDSDPETQRVIRRFVEGLKFLTRDAAYAVFLNRVFVTGPDDDLEALDRFLLRFPGQGTMLYTAEKTWTAERNRRRSTTF